MKISRYPALSLVFLLSAAIVSDTTLSARAQGVPVLKPEISLNVGGPRPAQRSPAALVDDLVEVAVHSQELQAQHLAASQQTGGTSHSAQASNLQHAIPDVININYRASRAAAQSYLGQTGQDRAGRELDEAKFRDQITVMVTAIMLQLATGLGERISHPVAGQATIKEGMEKLAKLVGKAEADWAFERLERFSQDLRPEPVETNGVAPAFGGGWDVLAQEEVSSKLATAAIERDQRVGNLKAMLGVHQKPPDQLEKTLSLLSMIPQVVATAALVGDQVLEMGNGGSREKRLSDVLSLGLQLDSREAAITRQSYLIAASLNAGRMNHNHVLSAFAAEMASRLSGRRF